MAKAEVQLFKTNFISFAVPIFLDQLLTDYPEPLNTRNVDEGGSENQYPNSPHLSLQEIQGFIWTLFNSSLLYCLPGRGSVTPLTWTDEGSPD